MLETTLPDGVFAFWMIFSVFQNNWVFGILGPLYCGIGATIRIGRELTVFLPPLPEVGCPIFLEIRNPWGKVMERSGLRFGTF